MNESIAYLHEVFDVFGPIRTRRMFGAYGIYHSDVMFGLYAAGRLYLKADADNVAQFQAQGSQPFTYTQRAKQVQLSYWSAPELMMDDRDQALFWARSAWDAAMRARAERFSKPRPRRPLKPSSKSKPSA